MDLTTWNAAVDVNVAQGRGGMERARRGWLGLLGFAVAASLAGCSAATPSGVSPAAVAGHRFASSPTAHGHQHRAATAPTKHRVTTPARQQRHHAEQARSQQAQSQPQGSNGYRLLGAGIVLPNPRRTPGAVSAAVTQSTIHRTICRTGYTSTLRPSSSYTTSLKVQQLASGYAWHGDRSTSDYEEDHLISLELGGAPSSPLNLWPEPYAAREGARVKDLVENKLHDLVCAGALTLRTAQRAIATNWWRAYQRYGGIAVPRQYDGTYGGSGSGSSSPAREAGSGGTDPRFDYCYEATAHGYGPYYRGRDPEYSWYTDADHDGVVCES
jgi:hypothetical protein